VEQIKAASTKSRSKGASYPEVPAHLSGTQPKAYEGDDIDLFERLRSLRKSLAQNQGVPPYMVFSDKTLHEMSRNRPVTLAGFREISGVGDAKLEKYGADFIQEIRVYMDKV
jgi:ATP-dependent DNA helicase RecQ